MEEQIQKKQHSVAASHDAWAILGHILDKAKDLIPHLPFGQHVSLLNVQLGYLVTIGDHHGHTVNVTITRLDGDPLAAPTTGFPGSGGFGAAYAAWTLVDEAEEG